MLAGGCAHPRACDDAWWGVDKQKHLAGSFLLAAGATLIAAEQTDPDQAAALGFGLTAATGAAKEAYDLEFKQTHAQHSQRRESPAAKPQATSSQSIFAVDSAIDREKGAYRRRFG